MQPSIGNYGIIGDTRTAALCSEEGSIDWLCFPRFDSDPVFGWLVDSTRGGRFNLRPEDVAGVSRGYRDGSAILETVWSTPAAQVEMAEGMILDVSSRLLPQLVLVREVACKGRTRLRIFFNPRFGLPGRAPRIDAREGVTFCTWGSLVLALHSQPPVLIRPGQEETVDLHDEKLALLLTAAEREPLVLLPPNIGSELLEQSGHWWRQWSGGIEYQGPERDMVVRSRITLRLLTYSPSGAPVAALTTSIPVEPGGVRNWDYRFAWPRDASIGVETFLRLAPNQKSDEALSFLRWLAVASGTTKPKMQVVYTLHGKPEIPERKITEVSGFRGGQPVRVGNAAGEQHQLDVYGSVLGAARMMVEAGQNLESDVWRAAVAFADFVCSSWRRPDHGIWEGRGKKQHYVHSKLMAWRALDSAIEIARTHRVRKARLRRWEKEREALSKEIRTRGFSQKKNAYVRSYESGSLDAANLLLPAIGFEESDSPRLRGTIEAVRKELGAGGRALLYRYPPGEDGLPGADRAFLPCSFWLVSALAAIGELEEAEAVFGEACRTASPLGLLSEQLDPASRELVGNFPQALTHASLLQAAISLRNQRVRRETPSSTP